MKRSLSKNPNMLRTMVGTGLTLIILLSYAVFSNTVDSEYYSYTTTNEHNVMDISAEVEGEASWYYTTYSAITWVNFTVENLYDPILSNLVVEESNLWEFFINEKKNL